MFLGITIVSILVIGFFLITIGHYEWKLRNASKLKVIYKFVDEWDEEKHARNQEEVYKKYGPMFFDESILS